jgi:hypothetical protein
VLTVPMLSRDLIQETKNGGPAFKLNSRYDPAVKSITGAPEANVASDAFREAYAALLLARLGATKVWLGEEARKLLYPPNGNKSKGEPDCDVVALVSGPSRSGFIVGDGKGKGLHRALTVQLPRAAELLQKTYRTDVIGGLIVGKLPAYLYSAGDDPDGIPCGSCRWLHSLGDRLVLGRLKEGLAGLMPPLNPQMYYLLDTELYDDANLPLWAVSKSAPHILYTHAPGGKRGPLRKFTLPATEANVELFVVGA